MGSRTAVATHRGVPWAGLALLWLVSWTAAADYGAPFGLQVTRLTVTEPGAALVRCDWETCQPATALVERVEGEGRDLYRRGGEPVSPPQDAWILRRPGWTPALLNAVGQPPDLTYDPRLEGPCDIYLGIRAVTPSMSFGIRLGSERDFTIVTAPAASETRHFDVEFHWKIRADMTGETIVFRALGKPVYLQSLRFVPEARRETTVRVPSERVAICREPGRHFAFPGVAELPNGDLAVVCREGVAHVCPFGRIVLVRSRDGGRTWDPREVVYDTLSDERDPAILVLPDRRVAVSCNTWHSWLADRALRQRYAAQTAAVEASRAVLLTGSLLLISSDHGRTWGAPQRVPVFSPHGPTLGPDGALYYVGSERRHGKQFTSIQTSVDTGRTWSRYADVAFCRPLAPDGVSWESYDEPNLGILSAGRWLTALRVDADGFVRLASSDDAGRTWSWPATLAFRGYPQHLCPLRDGRLILTYGYRFEPFGIRGCLSPDGGRTWDRQQEIVFRADAGHADLGYPVSIELRDGRVFTVYYTNQGSECYIEGVFWRP